MSQLNNINLTTPTNAKAYAFVPQSVDGMTATLQDRTSGVPMAYPKLSLSVSAPKRGSVHRVKVTISEPTLMTVNGVSSIERVQRASVEFLFNESSTVAERLNLREALIEALKDSIIIDGTDQLTGAF